MLAKLNDLGEEIALVPDSGVQIVDLALDLNKHRQLTRTFIGPYSTAACFTALSVAALLDA